MSKKLIMLNDIVEQCDGNIVSDMDGEKVMLSIQKGKYYNLGEMGGQIWERIKEPIIVSELIDHLLSEYNVKKDECERQVLSFLNLLLKEELITSKEIVNL